MKNTPARLKRPRTGDTQNDLTSGDIAITVHRTLAIDRTRRECEVEVDALLPTCESSDASLRTSVCLLSLPTSIPVETSDLRAWIVEWDISNDMKFGLDIKCSLPDTDPHIVDEVVSQLVTLQAFPSEYDIEPTAQASLKIPKKAEPQQRCLTELLARGWVECCAETPAHMFWRFTPDGLRMLQARTVVRPGRSLLEYRPHVSPTEMSAYELFDYLKASGFTLHILAPRTSRKELPPYRGGNGVDKVFYLRTSMKALPQAYMVCLATYSEHKCDVPHLMSVQTYHDILGVKKGRRKHDLGPPIGDGDSAPPPGGSIRPCDLQQDNDDFEVGNGIAVDNAEEADAEVAHSNV